MEMMMQYVWKHRLWPTNDLRTVDGRPLRVIDPGRHNTGPGPDFFNAKISLDGQIWAGNVEIHARASDWHRHGHEADPAYDTVILHVVGRDDTLIHRRGGGAIPQVVMPDAAAMRDRYLRLKGAPPSSLPCRDTIARMHGVHIRDWLTALGFERLYAKSDRLIELAARLGGDWEETAYVALARAMGFGINNDAFERLALALPLRCLRKHADSPEAVEAMLFGVAGLLDALDPADPYPRRLAAEYDFLAHKYGLTSIDTAAWRLGRMRPWNFPHRRVATLAAFIRGHHGLLATLVAIDGFDDLNALFDFDLEGYWRDHHRFGDPGHTAPRAISADGRRLLMINVAIPLIHAYATARGDHRRATRAAEMLEQLPPERNSIITHFESAGLKCADAFTSQALIELRRAYCEPRKCIYCRIGHRHLASRPAGR